MGLFNWFKSPSPPASAPSSSGLSRTGATQPFGKTQHPPSGLVGKPGAANGTGATGAANAKREEKKNARYMRRELLYGIVRESMIRAGVLSQGYKFKALALDPRGLQFIVMVDLAPEFGSSSARWGEIERLIATSAKTRHGIVVSAVYWRLSEQVSLARGTQNGDSPDQAGVLAGAAQAAGKNAMPALQALTQRSAQAAAVPAFADPQESPRRGTTSRPMPLFPEGPDDDAADGLQISGRPMPAQASAAASAALAGGRFEPIAEDEVEAFKRALAQGASSSALQSSQAANASAAAAARQSAQKTAAAAAPAAAGGNYTLLTGFEDTEAVDPDFAPPALGTTQYGELR